MGPVIDPGFQRSKVILIPPRELPVPRPRPRGFDIY
jgi:hypothetical protein